MFSRDFDRIMERQRQRLGLSRQPQQFLGKWRPNQNTRPVVNGDQGFSGKEPPEREPDWEPADSRVRILGLDLGQMKDPAAAVMISRRRFDRSHPNRAKPITGPVPPQLLPVEVELIHRWPKGTDYSKIVHFCLNLHEMWSDKDGKEVARRVPIDAVVFDMTGCGHPFRDFFIKEARAVQFPSKLVGINLSSSDTALKVRKDNRGSYMTVAKLEILTAINILVQQNLLVYLPSAGKRMIDALLEEMKTFQIKKTAAANLTFDQGGPGNHGDLVCALGLGCHYISRGFRQLELNTVMPEHDPWEDAQVVGRIR